MNCTFIEDNKHKNAGDLISISSNIEFVTIDQLHHDVFVEVINWHVFYSAVMFSLGLSKIG
jgi:ABC-type Zn uptake system ZnuABC Zn-binding protein ZnuA